MAMQFKVVGIIGRVKNPGVKETLKTLLDYLRYLKQDFVIESETASVLEDTSLPTTSRETLGQACELLIVIGGDGSLLNAAHAILNDEIPVVGINRGSLGFLTDIHPAELNRIKAILEGAFKLEKRFLLSVTTYIPEQDNLTSVALNEAALIPDAIPQINEFEMYINKQFVCSQHSDGLIIATPTGSTAYALSGGGPILHPSLDAIVIVPMFPHTLSIRPIVIEANAEIRIIISPNNRTTPRLSCDGQLHRNIPPGSEILIRKNIHALHLAHPLDYDYYESLRGKLHWGRKLHYAE